MTDKLSVKLNRTLPSGQPKHSCEKRLQTRLLCADLVQLSWIQSNGLRSSEIVILENISAAGVGLFGGVPLPVNAVVELSSNTAALHGVVRHCVFRENGYIIGVELDADSRWAQDPRSGFLPQHLLDVSSLDLS